MGSLKDQCCGLGCFWVYINDLDDHIVNAVFKFADDSKSVNSVGCDQDYDVAQKDLNALAAWSNDWQMPFNADKCTVMHLGHKNPEHVYKINNVPVTSTEAEKDLGVWISKDLEE